jgi:ubiquinone/menaquinone biosynthesis C-methylase UbiE
MVVSSAMMSTIKTDKERAFLHDLFVAPDWGERFAELIDEHVKLPRQGRVLYVGSGTGAHAIALQERAGPKLDFLCVDENAESLELSRAKATAVEETTEFREAQLNDLQLENNSFDLVIADGSLVHSERIPEILSELVRVAKPTATVALTLPTFSSFGEFFSIYWEALHNCGLIDHESDVENLISVLPAVSVMEEMADHAGLDEVSSVTRIEEFDYESADKFFAAPLILDFLLPIWLDSLPQESHEPVMKELRRLIGEESHGMAFALTVKATLVMGKKALAQ